VCPHAHKVAGEPLEMAFDPRPRAFAFAFRHAPAAHAPSRSFPDFQYPAGYDVEVTDGGYEMNREGQMLVYHHSAEQETHRIQIQAVAKLRTSERQA
jgi:hypothetical protein